MADWRTPAMLRQSTAGRNTQVTALRVVPTYGMQCLQIGAETLYVPNHVDCYEGSDHAATSRQNRPQSRYGTGSKRRWTRGRTSLT